MCDLWGVVEVSTPFKGALLGGNSVVACFFVFEEL